MSVTSIDITKEHCPMTFVRTKVALEDLASGDLLEVTLGEGEPLDNVPRTVVDQGYKVLSITPLGKGHHKVVIEKP